MADGAHAKVVVVDNGAEFIKAGHADRDICDLVFPNIVAGGKYVGDEAVAHDELEWVTPITAGKIEDWDAMELVWSTAFAKLNASPGEHNIFLSESYRNPRVNREKATEILFEKIGVSGMFLEVSSILALYASGRTTGIVIDIGADVTTAMPVADSMPVIKGIATLPIGANDVTTYMQKLLAKKGFPTGKKRDRLLARAIKTKLSYVSLDMDEESDKLDDEPETVRQSYELPDGKTILVDMERFVTGEVFLQPELVGIESHGIPKFIFDSIQGSPMDYRTPLYANVVLSGGSSLTRGLRERVAKDLVEVCPTSADVKVTTADEHSTWIGGAVISTLDSFQDKWVTKADFQEHGASIITKKCPVYEK